MKEIEKRFVKLHNAGCFLLKTNNGKYYDEFLSNGFISLYSVPVKKEGEAIVAADDRKSKEFDVFINDVKINDYIIIPSRLNKRVNIGQVTSNYYLDKEEVRRSVKWIKEISTHDLSSLFKYLHTPKHIVSVRDILDDIIRMLYPSFIKDNRYHYIISITQKAGISGRSLYGLYDLIFSELDDDVLEVKTVLKSPGILELITEKLEIILSIIKLFQIVIKIAKKKELTSDFEKTIAKKYHEYKLDNLKLNPPEFTNSDNEN